jgi:hypothetical protein
MVLSVTHTFVSALPDDPVDVAAGDILPQAHWNAAHTLTGTASVAQGGTGTGTAFTQGSVLFAGASGVYSQNNANFFWDNSIGQLKLNGAAPLSSFGGVLHVESTRADYVSMFKHTGGVDCYNQFLDNVPNIGEYGIWNGSFYFQCVAGMANGIQFIESPADTPYGGLAGISLKPATGNAARIVHGVSPMKFEAYNTFTDPSNYERGIFDWQGTSNVLTIGTEKLGTGSSRPIWLQTGNSGQSAIRILGTSFTSGINLSIASSYQGTGHGPIVSWGNNSATYYGVTGCGHDPNNANFASWWVGRSTSVDDTSATLQFMFGMDTGIFSIGGTSSSFPGLKNSGAVLQARLADDSANATFQANLLQTNTELDFTGTTATVKVNGTNRLDYGVTTASTWTLGADAAVVTSSSTGGNSFQLVNTSAGGYTLDWFIKGSAGVPSVSGLYSPTSNKTVWVVDMSSGNMQLVSGGAFAWSSHASFADITPDTFLWRDLAAGTLALSGRNSSAQSFRVYNTTDATNANYERGIFDWQGTSNVLTIGTEKLGTGTARNLQFVIGGTNKLDYGITAAVAWNAAAPLNVNAGTVTASTPAFNLAQTWNNAAIQFRAVNINATDTASDLYRSYLLNLQTNGVDIFSFAKKGLLYFDTYLTGSDACFQIRNQSGDADSRILFRGTINGGANAWFDWGAAGDGSAGPATLDYLYFRTAPGANAQTIFQPNGVTTLRLDESKVSLGPLGVFGFSTTTGGSTQDIGLARNAAGVLEVNSGTIGTFRDLVTRSVRGAAVTFANRPATPVEGMMVAFTDSTTNVWGNTITGTGANHVLGYYNGTNWTVAAK